MKAIILNSGIGSRLGIHTKSSPKCMVKIKDDITILQYQLRLLKAVGINEIIITTGYLADILSDYSESIADGLNITYVFNAEYLTTNYIKSLDLVEDFHEDVVMMHGDLVIDAEVLRRVVNSRRSCMVIDRGLKLPEKDFKAKMVADKVMAVGIDYFGTDCVAAQPLYKLQKNDWRIWKQSIRTFCEEGNVRVYAEEALNAVTDRMELNGLDADGSLCSEIDNEEDLLRIQNILKGDRVL